MLDAKQLYDVASLREGNLKDVPFSVLLVALAAYERSAVIDLERHQMQKRVVLENGVPVDCRSNLVHETLSRFLASTGKLSEGEGTALFQESVTRGVQFGQLLIEKGRLSPVELFRALQQNVAKKLLDLFTWREGAFRIGTDLPSVAAPLKVRVPQLVIMGITKFAAQDEVNAAVVRLVGAGLALHPMPPFPLEDIRLGPRQVPLLLGLREGKRMDELVMGGGLQADEVTRLVYALALLGLAVRADSLPADAKPPALPESLLATAAPVPAPQEGAEADQAKADKERLDNEVMQAYLSFRGQDAFDLLEAGEDTPLPVIQQKYLAYAERFRPARFEERGLAATAEKARELFLAGAAAYGELSDLERRRMLIGRRRTLREEAARRPPPDFTIKTDLLDPEVQFKKGVALFAEGRFKEAITQLEFAADCDPGNGVYRSELAYSRYRLAPDFAGPQSIKELVEAQRIDPGCGLASLYAGQILAALGRPDDAEKQLRRAMKLMHPDRRPIEALKKLKGGKA
jgi:tetratricopeptide (TPR) repeat protein